MKTPRDLLLARHRAAEPKLDVLRERVLGSALDSRPSPFATLLTVCWRELFWPCRRAWLGLAAAWVVILLLNFASAETPRTGAVTATADVQDLMQAWRQKQQLLAELMGQDAEPAPPPKRPAPRPHSERRSEFMIG